MLHPKTLTTISLCILCFSETKAQDVERVAKDLTHRAKEDPVSVSGQLGANNVFYKPFGIEPRRDPYYWVANANLTIKILDAVTIPFTAVVTQQDKQFTNGLDKFSQPFNQFGISPRYRWLTVHAGYRSMEFSEYTMNGAMFLGGGVEIKPEKSIVSGAVFHGRFVKAIPKGGVDGILVGVPAYERWGSGGRLRVGTSATWGELIAVNFRDDKFSIPADSAAGVTPSANQVIALATNCNIIKQLSAKGEFAYSIFTPNLYEFPDGISPALLSSIARRPSTRNNMAMNGGLEYNAGKAGIGMRYKRIDPDYRTLGSPFLTNDVEEISVNGNCNLLKSRVNLATAIGLQRNNLDRSQLLTARRVIGSANLSLKLSERLLVNGMYSSFSSNTIPMRDVYSDSIRFVQLTTNGNISTCYNAGNSRIMHSVILSTGLQQSAVTGQVGSSVATGNISYQLQLPANGWSFNLSGLVNRSTTGDVIGHESAGPSAAITKSCLKNRLRITVSHAMQYVFLYSKALSTNESSALSVNYSINKHQSIRTSMSALRRTAVDPAVQPFTELRGNIGYQYNFLVKRKTGSAQ